MNPPLRVRRRPLLPTGVAGALLLGLACTSSPPSSRPAVREALRVRFVDVTESAGLTERQSEPRNPPDCLFNAAEPRPGYDPSSSPAGCMEERMSGGAAAGDADGDGRIDLYLTRLHRPGLLYRNAGDGTFADVTTASGLDGVGVATNGAAFADLDNDGDQDLYVTTIGATGNLLYVNDGQGRFTEEAQARGAAVADDAPRAGFGVAVGDYDLDGWLDLHVTEWRGPSRQGDGPPEHERLLRNLGARRPGHFEDATDALRAARPVTHPWPRLSFASTFVDLDDDGRPELAVAGDFATSQLFWNEGNRRFDDGRFSEGLTVAFNAMGSTFGDFDGDGRLDWFTTGIDDPRMLEMSPLHGPGTTPIPSMSSKPGNRLARNRGDRTFEDVTDEAGVARGHWGWGAAFLDCDNDGHLDLLSATGQTFPDGAAMDAERRFVSTPPMLWRNLGDGRFEDAGASAGLNDTRHGKGLLVFDYDEDGDVDVFIANNGDRPTLYRNDGGNAASWLRVRVEGSASNRDGTGAVVTLIASDGREQVRHVGVGSHFLGQSEPVAHFGLGTAAGIREVRVHFPRSGRTARIADPPANKTLDVEEPDA